MMIVEDRCTILQIWETGDAETSEEAAMDLMHRPPSDSQFTREYKRLFGAPPMRDVERLREAAVESAGL